MKRFIKFIIGLFHKETDHKGLFDKNKIYSGGNIVEYRGNDFRCMVYKTERGAEFNISQWEKLTTFFGEHNERLAYKKHDITVYKGNYCIAKKDISRGTPFSKKDWETTQPKLEALSEDIK